MTARTVPVLVDEAGRCSHTRSETGCQSGIATRTVRGADRIVVLKDGQVAEVGSHQELLARDGL